MFGRKCRTHNPEGADRTQLTDWHADLLKSVRGDPTLQHLSGDVQAICKTASVGPLQRLSKARVHSTKEVEDAVGKALGDRAAVFFFKEALKNCKC